jgi:chemotaxis protein methyltransferase CheR
MTTNETSFYRDQKPFGLFEQVVMPCRNGQHGGQRAVKKIRIWCCCGVNWTRILFTLSMLLKEKAALWKDFTIEIVGTDISRRCIRYGARRSIFTI